VSAKEFKKLRDEKGYTQTELADVLRVTSRTISRWETGRRKIPHIAIMAIQGLKKKGKGGKRA
jgi:transcriptional regulator with XRE-family HTH domain